MKLFLKVPMWIIYLKLNQQDSFIFAWIYDNRSENLPYGYKYCTAKAICVNLHLKERSFYRSIARLKDKHLINVVKTKNNTYYSFSYQGVLNNENKSEIKSGIIALDDKTSERNWKNS